MRLSFPPISHNKYSHIGLCFFNLLHPFKLGPLGPRWAHTDSTTTRRHRLQGVVPHAAAAAAHHKVVVIMGPTGCGKSRLSIELATRFFPCEIINSDKIQVYRGLDITTNKIPMHDRLGVPHHLLGEFDPSQAELTPSDFRSFASAAICSISSRRKLPLLVGGSNSFIYALLAKRFDPTANVFGESLSEPISAELRYRCCFLWVDVSLPILNQYLCKRVDEMLDSGMFEELAQYFDREGADSPPPCAARTGLRKAIGVPEFERYFRGLRRRGGGKTEEEVVAAYEEAVEEIKENTIELARRQREKIMRLREGGWELRTVDATDVFKAAMGAEDGGGRSREAWEKQVMEPSVKIVKQFLVE